MLWSLTVAASLGFLVAESDPAPTVSVTVDSSRHELTVTSGPFDLPNMPPMEDHAMMDLGMSHDTRLQRFRWPVDGWFRGFRVELIMLWTPKNQNPPPVNALPIYMDVNLTVGGTNTFDVPPGKSSKAYEFTLPTSGRLLGVGGHMHDYGTRVRLEDAETGKVLTQVVAERSPDGKLVKVSRK